MGSASFGTSCILSVLDKTFNEMWLLLLGYDMYYPEVTLTYCKCVNIFNFNNVIFYSHAQVMYTSMIYLFFCVNLHFSSLLIYTWFIKILNLERNSLYLIVLTITCKIIKWRLLVISVLCCQKRHKNPLNMAGNFGKFIDRSPIICAVNTQNVLIIIKILATTSFAGW